MATTLLKIPFLKIYLRTLFVANLPFENIVNVGIFSIGVIGAGFSAFSMHNVEYFFSIRLLLEVFFSNILSSSLIKNRLGLPPRKCEVNQPGGSFSPLWIDGSTNR